MSKLYEFTTAHCPFNDVPDRLYAHFDGDHGTIPLRVSVADLRVERDVDIHFSARPEYPGYRMLNVEWKPKDGGPYPAFAGSLSIADEGLGWSRIELAGKYDPPFGLAGAAFDAIAGHRIAQATAAELLAEFKRILTAP
jgi:hypothetical protein